MQTAICRAGKLNFHSHPQPSALLHISVHVDLTRAAPRLTCCCCRCCSTLLVVGSFWIKQVVKVNTGILYHLSRIVFIFQGQRASAYICFELRQALGKQIIFDIVHNTGCYTFTCIIVNNISCLRMLQKHPGNSTANKSVSA